jgi:Domain of unknown function (DUF6431)
VGSLLVVVPVGMWATRRVVQALRASLPVHEASCPQAMTAGAEALALGAPGGEAARVRDGRGAPDFHYRRAPRRTCVGLIVSVPGWEAESLVEVGVGPPLPAGARCPVCVGELGRHGSYPRSVRRLGEQFLLRVGRAICRACGGTHALLPSFLFARRLDLAEAIGRALRLASEGRGHPAAALALRVPATTVRSWLRRLRRRADRLHSGFAWLAVALGAELARPPPSADPLAWLCEAIAAARAAASERFGAAAVGSV